MALAAGSKFGPYEILALIGAGGMGEVYRARDMRLKREVALKTLPDAFADDPDRMARFQREAEVLASLNHPNIAHIYGIEERALAMELIEGESPRGPMPFEDAWKLASQIAEALDYAHEKGIIHRDLKPANIKVTQDGIVKLLDFGLAKAFSNQPVSTSGDPTNSPTVTLSGTVVGAIMGTAAYMSPEQAKGKSVDKRADIWAFGVMLYELLTGERPFKGEDVPETLAHVLTKEPDWTLLPAGTPRRIRELLEVCLQRDPAQRLRDIGDARIQIQKCMIELASGAEGLVVLQPSSRTSHFVWVGWATAASAILASATLALIHFREKSPAQETVRFQIPAPVKSTLSPAVTVSPDGRKLIFIATGPDNRRHLWVRPLDSLDARVMADVSDGSIFPFWSPDSSNLGFWTEGKLKKLEAAGGSPQTLCDATGTFVGGAWSQAGVIIFGHTGGGLWQVPADGGTPGPLTKVDPARQELRHEFPAFLPDGRHFLYLRTSTNRELSGIFIGSLDAKPEQQSSQRITATQQEAVYVPSAESRRNGYLLFMREQTLMAQPFDMARMNLASKPVPIADEVAGNGGAYAIFSASSNGVLAYRRDEAGAGIGFGNTQLTWYDRQGKVVGTAGESGLYNAVALSPDGTRVAAMRTDPRAASQGGQRGNTDIWLHEFSRGISTRFTFDPAVEWLPVWSPDGSRIVFASTRDGPYDLYEKPSSGAGNEAALLKSGETKLPYDWSPDGHFLLYAQSSGSRLDLWVLPFSGDNRKPSLYLKTEFSEGQARFSPDGRFVAYTSNESGKNEVYVQPFPLASSGKWMVSKDGGVQPRWRHNGKELYYISADSKLMAVEMSLNPVFKSAIPKALFPVPVFGGTNNSNATRYDVAADGQRFLINSVTAASESGAPTSPPLTVVLNWQAGLKK